VIWGEEKAPASIEQTPDGGMVLARAYSSESAKDTIR